MTIQSQSKIASATVTLGCLIAIMHSANAYAGDVSLLSSAAIKPVIEVLGPQFERASGHRLVSRFELTPAVKKLIDAGTPFDVAIANPPHIEDSIKQGRVTAGTRADVARFGVGVGVRAGAAKPDVGSPDALKAALINAKSVAYVGEGTSGVFVRALLDRLGIADAMKAKLRPGGIAESLAAVAKGEAEIVVMPVPLIMAGVGVDFAGALPAALQDNIDMVAGIGANAKDRAAAQALVKYLMGPEATTVIKARGFSRVSP
jgi:molybdate transport system substrate-binding protein